MVSGKSTRQSISIEKIVSYTSHAIIKLYDLKTRNPLIVNQCIQINNNFPNRTCQNE